MRWNNRWFQFFILLVLAFIWGSSFILMKIGLKSFSSNQAAAIRVFLASLVLLPYSLRNIKHIKKKDVKSILIAGFLGSLIPAFLFTKAQTRIDSALAGMLNSLTPVFTLLVGYVFYKTRIRYIQIVGLILGLLGASGLIAAGSGLMLENLNTYALFVVLATVCYALNINVVKTNLSHLTGVQITSLSFFFVGPVALGYLFFTDFGAVAESIGWGYHLGALAILGVLGTAVAMLLMNSLIRHISAVYASSVTYIIPIFAIAWGLLDGEDITIYHLVFMLLILVGVYLINRKK